MKKRELLLASFIMVSSILTVHGKLFFPSFNRDFDFDTKNFQKRINKIWQDFDKEIEEEFENAIKGIKTIQKETSKKLDDIQEKFIKQVAITTIGKREIEFKELEDTYKITITLPNVYKTEDIKLHIDDEKALLTVSAKEKEEKKEEEKKEDKTIIHQTKIATYQFPPAHIKLPQDADTKNINAEYEQGILKIMVPKKKKVVEKKKTSGREIKIK